MSYEYDRKCIKEISKRLIEKGMTVYIAASGTYGFFTDDKKDRLVSFQSGLEGVTFSGNYKTDNGRETGTGWRMDIRQSVFTIPNYSVILYSDAPHWAIKNATKVEYKTVKEHLAFYQKSSKYKQVTLSDLV